jgi:hypothetical protein
MIHIRWYQACRASHDIICAVMACNHGVLMWLPFVLMPLGPVLYLRLSAGTQLAASTTRHVQQ